MHFGALPPRIALLFAAAALAPASVSAAPQEAAKSVVEASSDDAAATSDASDPFAKFTPTADPMRHRIDYSLWDHALKNIVISMGPSTRQTAGSLPPAFGTNIRQGHNSRYRLEGSLVSFLWLEREVIASLTQYREDLESIGDTLDIAQLPRNEQLAYWINLHNVGMVEQLAVHWPVRQPRELEVDGVLLDDAKFLSVSGVSMSLKDIREKIVYANWRDPKVVYGFWRGEIGSPALQRDAFNASNVGSLLDLAAGDFINSLRGTQKSGSRLDVSTLYDEVRAFYFPDFGNDVRAHIAAYAAEDVTEILAKTSTVRASIYEHDIADLSGGRRLASYLFVEGASSRVPQGVMQLLRQRENKFDNMRRREVPTGRVIFSNIELPGDPPNKNAVQ